MTLVFRIENINNIFFRLRLNQYKESCDFLGWAATDWNQGLNLLYAVFSRLNSLISYWYVSDKIDRIESPGRRWWCRRREKQEPWHRAQHQLRRRRWRQVLRPKHLGWRCQEYLHQPGDNLILGVAANPGHVDYTTTEMKLLTNLRWHWGQIWGYQRSSDICSGGWWRCSWGRTWRDRRRPNI